MINIGLKRLIVFGFICPFMRFGIFAMYLETDLSCFQNALISCQQVGQALRTIINSFLESIIYWLDYSQFLLLTTITALTPIWIPTSKVEAGSLIRWFGVWYLQATVCLRGRRRCMSMLLALFARLHQAVKVSFSFSIETLTSRTSGFGISIGSGASRRWIGRTRW